MQLHYKELGKGQPIIILHGLFGSGDNWLTLGKKLAEHYHVFLIDQRNHGRSPQSTTWDYAAMQDDLKNFIKFHSLHNVIIIGHSMGGKTAIFFAQAHPQLLEKLIIVDIAPRYYPVHHQIIVETLLSVKLDEVVSRQEVEEKLKNSIEGEDTIQFLMKNLYRTEDQKLAWRINLPVISENLNNVGEAPPEIPITIPTLFIRGGKSNYIREEDKALIHKIFTNVEMDTIEKAGHWVQAEAPMDFLNVVNGFLQK